MKRSRFFLLQGLLLSVMLGYGGLLWHLQVQNGADYHSQALSWHCESQVAARGGIFDRNAVPLAVNAVSWTLACEIPKMQGQTARLLTVLAEQGVAYDIDTQETNKQILAQGLSQEVYLRVLEHDFAGVTWTAEQRRCYPTGTASHVLGYLGNIPEETWQDYAEQGYALDAEVGREGIEAVFEAVLRAQNGKQYLGFGREDVPRESRWSPPAKAGKHVYLTLDANVQAHCEAVLAREVPKRTEGGAGLAVLEVETGAVLALVSYPSFDLNRLGADYARLANDPNCPLFSRAVQGLYAPGSTLKPLVGLAALEEGIIDPETEILDTGIYRYYETPQPSCWLYREQGKTHGKETLSEALRDSCNIFFYDIGRRLGIERLGDYAHAFGLGEKTGIELLGEAEGQVASPDYTASQGQTWYAGNTLSAVIGQENNRMTPLQLASYTATLANGGTRYAVHLLDRIVSPEGECIMQTEKEVLGTLPMQEEHIEAVQAGMLAVTQEGSCKRAFADFPQTVCVKTGSVQVAGQEKPNAVFIAFTPAQAPKIALALVVEGGGKGAELGDMVREILEFTMHNGKEK